MLAPRYLAGISDDIVELYAQLEADILADMARRIKKIGAITDASKFQAGILEQCGGLKQDISKILSKYDKSTIQQVSSIFTDALQKSVEADNRIFQEATGRTVTENQAQAMIAAIQKTHSDLQSLTMTTAVTSQQDFIKQANAAYMEVSTGAFDYDTAMKHAADNLAEHGVTTVQYENGKAVTRTIESAVRMNILTGVNQTAAAVTMDNCDELNCNLVEVSAHEGARPEHAAWQGKVYSLNGRVMNDDGTVKYESFDVCGYGEVDGICGINCRHSFYPYFEGYSQQHYAQKDIEEMSKKDYEYNGQKMTRYEAEQTLRKTERTIRAYKRRITTEEAVGADTKSAQLKLGEWQAKARDIVKQTGIQRDYAREYVGTSGAQPKAVKPATLKINTATLQKDYNAIVNKYGNRNSVLEKATKQEIQTVAAYQTSPATTTAEKVATDYIKSFNQQNVNTEALTKAMESVTTQEEKEALHTWTGSMYNEINDYLRNGVQNDSAQKYAGKIHDALEKCKTPEMYVRRGARKDYITKLIGSDEWENDPQTLLFRKITDKGFLATTPDTRGGFSRDVMIYYKVPQKTSGAYIDSISHFSGVEKEMLFQNETGARIIEVRTERIGGHTRYIIIADMIQE